VKYANSKRELLFLILSLAPSIAVSIVIIFATPEFKELYSSFGNDLPQPTRLVSSFYYLTIILPILIFLVWKNWPFQKYRSVYCILIGCFSAALMLHFWVLAMYLPIYKLGAP
jgi:type II secretory pathway component PulF